MATYYVRKSGNDTTGDGSSGNPWLTCVKALVVIGTGGPHTVKVGPGTYTEQSAGPLYYWNYNKTHADWVSWEAEDPTSKPVITGTPTGVYTMRLIGAGYCKFTNLVFDEGAQTRTSSLISMSSGDNRHIEFYNCEFKWSAGTVNAITGTVATGKYVTDLVIENCVFTQVGSDASLVMYGLRLDPISGTPTISNITVRNCLMQMEAFPIWIYSAANFLIDGGVYTSASKKAITINTDAYAAPGYASSGTIRNAYISSGSSHALLVGWGANGVTISGCTVVGGDQAIVIKECTNVTAIYNNVTGGTDDAILFKGATASSASDNTVKSSAGWAISVIKNNVSPFNKSGTITVTRNKVILTATGKVFLWNGASDDLGGGVCDYNEYDVRRVASGTAPFGVMKGDAHVYTLAELRAAWSGYGDGSNDSHSRVYAPAADMLLGR